MIKKFHEFDKIIQIILLVIPFVNWVTEMILRWDEFLSKKETVQLVCALVATFFFGNILGWIDAIYFALNDKLLLED